VLMFLDIKTPTDYISGVKFKLPGKHNLMNALMAFSMANSYGISREKIVNSLASFAGIKRRFSYQIQQENLIYIDDYAHHPTEIEAVHNAVRELYPNKKVVAVFQPHLYSRTRDFIDGFAKSLQVFDEIILLDIYPARELPIEGVTSSWLLSKIINSNKKIVQKDELLQALVMSDATVYVTIGAGDIGELVDPIKKALYEKTF